MPTFRSVSVRDADIYYLDFKQKSGHFYYLSDNQPTLRSRVYASMLAALPLRFWNWLGPTVWILTAISIIGMVILSASRLIVFVTVAFWFLIPFSRVTAWDANAYCHDPHAEESNLHPSLLLEAANLTNPLLLRFDDMLFEGLRFWFNGDVEQRVQKALVMRILDEKNEGTGWLMSVQFDGVCTSGQFALAFL